MGAILKRPGGVSMMQDIGNTAGKIYKYLEANGKTRLSELEKKIDVRSEMVRMAVGWLAREDKLRFDTEKKSVFVSLKG
jgi:predicted transcriptional regulator